jgi:aryl-alcohol dehydrogenase-like predicted oxidoreductase
VSLSHYRVIEHCLDSSDSQDESQEIFLGEWMEKRGIRDQLVITTKVIQAASVDRSCP